MSWIKESSLDFSNHVFLFFLPFLAQMYPNYTCSCISIWSGKDPQKLWTPLKKSSQPRLVEDPHEPSLYFGLYWVGVSKTIQMAPFFFKYLHKVNQSGSWAPKSFFRWPLPKPLTKADLYFRPFFLTTSWDDRIFGRQSAWCHKKEQFVR